MKLLLYDMSTYTQTDIMATLDEMGIEYRNILYKFKDIYEDSYFVKRVRELMNKEKYNAVFSVNYFPVLAEICHEYDLPYISWTYDSPLNIERIDETVHFDTNYLFMFDRVECENFKKKGIAHVYHLSLAVRTDRLDGWKANSTQRKRFGSEISMVGQLYDSSFQGLILPLKPYEKGYISAIIETQMKLYGAYILKDVITEELLLKMNQAYRELGQNSLELTKEGLEIGIAKYITHMERMILLDTLSEQHELKLYGPKTDEELTKVKWMGSAGYFNEMPYIFKESKINLNISLKCIQSGIPLRCLDILGCGGFLLSNWQTELAEQFADGEEVVLYSSLEDAVGKADYYLRNEKERQRIALNGYKKVQEHFRYEDRIAEMLRICGLWR